MATGVTKIQARGHGKQSLLKLEAVEERNFGLRAEWLGLGKQVR